MVSKLINKGKKLLISPQSSILSAATVIMFMVVASRVLGLVRQRVLAHFFVPDDLSLFFAAFRLPDLVFEVLVFGTFASAFIPVFTKEIKKSEKEAWYLASIVVNIGILSFTLIALLLSFFSGGLYKMITPGFSPYDQEIIANLAKILFVAQGFFVVSYVLTGVLESMRRFLIPALAPLMYNLGIIFGTLFLSERLGLLAPAIGVIVGAFLHFSIQLPLAIKLGFRFLPDIKITQGVKRIGKLALPRIIEVAFLQILKFVELYFASIISVASYTYYTFGNSLQLLPIGLFGTSIAKAALPTLSGLSEEKVKFKNTLIKSLGEMIFLIAPLAITLIVLRIPIIRLVYGTDLFSWSATVETSTVLSAFGVGILFQALISLLSRGFYALHDTKTPVITSILSLTVVITLDYVFVRVMGLRVWSLALAFSAGSIIQATSLFILLFKKSLGVKIGLSNLISFSKPIISSLLSGAVMFFLLRFFDRYTWVKRLSFLGSLEISKNINFESFVLDTRYTINLIALTFMVSLFGISTYLFMSYVTKTKELATFITLGKRIFGKKLAAFLPQKDQEPLTPPTTDLP